MKIYVRRRHIKRGRKRDPTRCPIALAYKEASGLQALVCISSINCAGGSFTISAATKRFIKRFDAGKPVKPFAFTIK